MCRRFSLGSWVPVHKGSHPLAGVPVGNPPRVLHGSYLLKLAGPILPVQVDLPSALSTKLLLSGQTIPSPVAGVALIDTGASHTCVDERTVQRLGLQPINVTTMRGATGSAPTCEYLARLTFPGTPLQARDPASVLGVKLNGLAAGNYDGYQGPFIVLIGRDVLADCVLTYDGPQGTFTLVF